MVDLYELMRKAKRLYRKKQLIGEILFDYLDDEEFENELYKFVIPQIRQYIQFATSTCEYPEYILTALTFIALKYYNGNFWDKVTEKFNEISKKMSEIVFQYKLREFLREYTNFSQEHGRLIDLPVINSIVPANFMHGFFQFCYDIYYYNLRCSLKNYDRSELELVYNSLRKSISFDDKTDKLNVRGFKVYALKQSTKKIISNCIGIESLIILTERVIEIIDNYYWDKYQPPLSSYFNIPYQSWKKTLNQEEKQRGVSEAKKRTEFVKWTPKFVLINNRVYLETRDDNISDVYDKKDLIMEIFDGGTKPIDSRNNLHASDMIGGYRLKSERFELKNPLHKISYRLRCGETIIYNSNEDLYRDYLLFRSNGNEIKNHTEIDNELIGFVIKKEDAIPNCNQKIEREYYDLWYKKVKMEDQFIISNKVIDFVSMPQSGVVGKIADNCYVKYDRKCKIYNEIYQIVVSYNEPSDLIVVNFNDKRYRIAELPFINLITKNNHTSAIIDFTSFQDDYYHITFDILGTKRKLDNIFTFVLDREFSNCIVKKNNEYKFVVKSSYYETTEFDFELNDKWETDVYFDYPHYDDLPIILTFDLPIYKIDNQWLTFDNYIWRNDLLSKKNFYIAGMKIKNIQILDENMNVLAEKLKTSDVYGTYKLSSETFYSYFKSDLLYLNVLDEKGDKHSVKVVNKIIFEDLLIDYNLTCKTLKLTPVYVGRGNVSISINDSPNPYRCTNGSDLIISNIEPFTYYQIRVFAMDFSSFSKITFYNERVIFCDHSKMVGLVFKINKCIYYNYDGIEFEENKKYIEDTYVKIQNEIQEGIYEVKLLKKVIFDGQSKYKLFKNLLEQKIEFVNKINNKGRCKAVIFSEDDLLLYDLKNKTIYNGDNNNLYPIEEFELEFWR